MKFLKQATYVRYVIANLPKFVQISMLTPQNLFYSGFFENFQATFFLEFFDKKGIL